LQAKENASQLLAGGFRSFFVYRQVLDSPDVEAYPCLNIMKILWANLTKDPENPKFKTLNTHNKKISSDMLSVDGALKFMLATGWAKVTEPKITKVTDR
jgi:hypothetical protein